MFLNQNHSTVRLEFKKVNKNFVHENEINWNILGWQQLEQSWKICEIVLRNPAEKLNSIGEALEALKALLFYKKKKVQTWNNEYYNRGWGLYWSGLH